jgi:dTDP-4-amino-4,6-dideoxygalactose transaminase
MPHRWEFVHDSIGYNYRMPNLNAALACAQLEMLEKFVENKRELHKAYENAISGEQIKLVSEIDEAFSNYWLNAIILNSKEERDLFLSETNSNGVMSRPVWELMHRLEMFKNSQKGNLDNSIWLAERLVNIPSSVRL